MRWATVARQVAAGVGAEGVEAPARALFGGGAGRSHSSYAPAVCNVVAVSRVGQVIARLHAEPVIRVTPPDTFQRRRRCARNPGPPVQQPRQSGARHAKL